MASLLSFGRRAFDQVNPLDNGRTFKQRTPTNNRSVLQQATHNGLTNSIGNFGVKPFLINPAQTVSEVPRMLAADISHNAPARQASLQRQSDNIRASLPAFFVKQGANIGQAGYNLGFKAPILDLKGNAPAAEKARVQGLKEFNQTLPGSASRPLQIGIANLAHANKQQQAKVGLDPNATGAQKYFADPILGALGTVGLAKGATSILPKGKVPVTEIPKTGKQTSPPKPVNAEPAYLRQRPLSQTKKNVSAAERQYKQQQSSMRDTGTPAYLRQTQQGLQQLLGQALPALSPYKEPLALPESVGPIKGPGFTMTPKANPVILNLGKQIGVIDKQLQQVRQGKGTLSPPQVRNLVQQRAALAQQVQHPETIPTPTTGVGRIRPDGSVVDKVTPLNEIPKTPAAKAPDNLKMLNIKIKNVKDPGRKAELIAERQALQSKVPNNTPDLNLPDVPTYTGAPKSPGAFGRAWQTVNGVISQHGTGGAEIAKRNGLWRGNSEVGQEAFLEKIPTVSKLKKNDFTTFVQSLERLSNGEKINVAPHIQRAIGEWNRAIPEIRDRALKAGLDVGDLGPNYFPRTYKDINTQKGFDRLVQHLVDQGKTPAEAQQAVQFMRHEYQKPYGNLEKTRQFDGPGYEMTHEALGNYIARSFDRISKAEQFGGKNEILNQLRGRAQQEGYNTAPGSPFDRSIKIALGDVDKTTAGHRVSAGIRKFNAATSLSTAGISNATQLTNTATVAGIGRTFKGAVKLAVSKNARAEAKQSGVALDHSLTNLANQSQGVSGPVLRNLASPFFKSVEKFNRLATAVVGKDYGNHLARKGDVAQLREKFGVTGEIGKQLTRDQEIQVSRKLVELSQFKVDPMDLPGWVDSPLGKMAAQFRTFGYKQSDFMYNQVLREATKGNFLPLGRFIAVGVPAGGAALVAKGAIKRAPLIQSNDNNASKVTKSLSQVGGFGLPGSEGLNIYNSAKYKNTPGAIASTVGGPTASLAVETGDNIRTGQQKKDWSKLEKEGLRKIPAVGPTLANTLIPKKDDPKYKPIKDIASATPDQLKTLAGKEAADLNAKRKSGGYGIAKLSDGTYWYQAGENGAHTTSDIKTARKAVALAQLKASDKNSQVVGDKFYYKKEDGEPAVVPLYKHQYDIADSQNQLDMTTAKDDGDWESWNNAAAKEIKAYETLRDKYNQDSQADKVDDVNKKIETLKHTMKKYSGYGGSFTKGGSGGGSGRSSSGSGSRGGKGSYSVPKVASSKISKPKGVSVKKLAAPKAKTTSLKKLSVSKIPISYKSKKIG